MRHSSKSARGTVAGALLDLQPRLRLVQEYLEAWLALYRSFGVRIAPGQEASAAEYQEYLHQEIIPESVRAAWHGALAPIIRWHGEAVTSEALRILKKSLN